MNEYRVVVDFSGALDYTVMAEDAERAKHKAMLLWLQEVGDYDFDCAEIVTARPSIVENLTTGEVEYEEDM